MIHGLSSVLIDVERGHYQRAGRKLNKRCWQVLANQLYHSDPTVQREAALVYLKVVGRILSKNGFEQFVKKPLTPADKAGEKEPVYHMDSSPAFRAWLEAEKAKEPISKGTANEGEQDHSNP